MDFLEAAALISVCLGKTEATILLPFQEIYIPYGEALLKLFHASIPYLEELSIYLK
jgi:hypothetical protein